MNKVLLLLGMIGLGSSVIAQSVDPSDFQRPENSLRKSREASIPNAAPVHTGTSRLGGDLIWSETFNGQASFADWDKDVNGPGSGFVWSTTGPTGPFSDPSEIIESTTANNGFIILRSDSANDDGAGGSGGVPIDATTSDTVNIPSGVNGVYITLEHAFRYFIADQAAPFGLEMWILDDLNDTIAGYDLIGEVSTNAGSANPVEGIKYYAPTNGSTYISIVFRHYNISNYFWQIDDISIFEAHDTDLTVEDVYLKGYDITLGTEIGNIQQPVYRNNFYSQIPRDQAANLNLNPSVVYKNNGVQTPATVSASFSITGPTGFTYSNSAPSTSIPSSGGIDSIDATTGITSGSTESGNYTATVSIDGGTDGAPSDNSTSLLFAGTANKYSWDNLPPSRIRRLEADDLLGIAYEAYSDDTIIGVELGIFDPASSSSVGTVMSVFIYKYSDIIESLDARINQGGGTFVNPVGTILSAYELTAADVNSYSEFKITNQIPMEAGETYVVAIKNLAGDQLWILFDPGVTASPWSVFETATTDFAGTGDTWFTENIVPHIRLLTKNSQVCDITTIDANGTVIPDYENFLVSIDLTPNGGSQPYVYSWSGPDGFSSEEQDLADLDVKGTYTVIIVDDNGCIGGASYVVDGNIGINDVANGAVVNVFPNPSNGSFNVSLDNVAGNYSINVSNSLGQVAASKNVSASGSNQIVEFSGLDLPVGVYTVSVVSTDDNSTLNVIKVVVE